MCVYSGDCGVGLVILRFLAEYPTPVFLPGESQGRGSLVGCRLWGRTESDTTEAISSNSRIADQKQWGLKNHRVT